MNHRYAYCSKDQDPDQDHEDMPLTPGAGINLGGRLALETPLSMEDTQTPHSFLSDCSLDGPPEVLKEEEEEEDKEARDQAHVEEANLSLLGEQVEDDTNQESQGEESREKNERNSCNVGNHIDIAESQLWNRNTEDQNADLDKCELSLDITDLPRIKT